MASVHNSGSLKVRMMPPSTSLDLNIYERLPWRSDYDASTEKSVPDFRTGWVV